METQQRPTTPAKRIISTPLALSPPRAGLKLIPATIPGSNFGPLSPVDQNGSFAFDRIVKSGKISRRVKKKGVWKSSWKQAYLVLRPTLLSVYKTEDETGLRASIDLSEITAVAAVKKTRTEHVFGVFTTTKNYHFAAGTAAEAQDWIAAIRSSTQTGQQSPTDPPNTAFEQPDNLGYESTDFSADDALEPGSPTALQWPMAANKSRSSFTDQHNARKTSFSRPVYPGDAVYTTSQSDFSDTLATSLPVRPPRASISVPLPTATLPTIPDGVPVTGRPQFNRSASHLSNLNTPATPISEQRRNTLTIQANAQQIIDPERVVKQSTVKLSKSSHAGIKQWKSVWMVLRASNLGIYKSDAEYAPLLIISLDSLVEAAEVDKKHRSNCFQVISEEKTVAVQAESEQELLSWLAAFKSVLNKSDDGKRSSRQNTGNSGVNLVLQPATPTIPESMDEVIARSDPTRSVSVGNAMSAGVGVPRSILTDRSMSISESPPESGSMLASSMSTSPTAYAQVTGSAT